MKRLSKIIENQKGAMGWALLWILGIPIPNFTLAVRDARVHILATRPGIADPLASKLN